MPQSDDYGQNAIVILVNTGQFVKLYTGCHNYVPLGRFARKRQCDVYILKFVSTRQPLY
jgi:hypothetical protein